MRTIIYYFWMKNPVLSGYYLPHFQTTSLYFLFDVHPGLSIMGTVKCFSKKRSVYRLCWDKMCGLRTISPFVSNLSSFCCCVRRLIKQISEKYNSIICFRLFFDLIMFISFGAFCMSFLTWSWNSIRFKLELPSNDFYFIQHTFFYVYAPCLLIRIWCIWNRPEKCFPSLVLFPIFLFFTVTAMLCYQTFLKYVLQCYLLSFCNFISSDMILTQALTTENHFFKNIIHYASCIYG